MKRNNRRSSSVKAGIIFSVSRVPRYLKEGEYTKRTSKCAGVYLAAVLEYLTTELLEVSNAVTQEKKKKMITPRFVTLAVRKDEELDKLLVDVIIAQGGRASWNPSRDFNEEKINEKEKI